MAHKTKRRVVITGLGAITANGIGKEAFWEATSKGISGIKPIQRFSADNLPLQVAGEINNFLANDYIERKLVNRTDRMTHFVFATIQEALQDARITLAQGRLPAERRTTAESPPRETQSRRHLW